MKSKTFYTCECCSFESQDPKEVKECEDSHMKDGWVIDEFFYSRLKETPTNVILTNISDTGEKYRCRYSIYDERWEQAPKEKEFLADEQVHNIMYQGAND
jgi:hypothetical protein